ncbi:SigE family RNA polymerase sigma factor [Actinomadura rudentiformis]|uniref:SigE family RNA polymerase sigma factor n=1 Tax=Actinomadura rudentiformis TaxID=359158 RepID=A0A6H9YU40_9ACTN|nr:SigE family RNA polymerase sigma factor [Actinomadura rudentiformis]KAB2350371.1 SigE family RNA polymerase sigma factor [Actinomadura rudentiformis]
MRREARESITAFIEARSTSLIRTAYALTGDQHAAEDLLQSALTKTILRWRHVRDNPEAYVRRAMYNEQVSRWRRAREQTTGDPPEIAVRDESGDVDLRLSLESALLCLPPRKRAVLVLRYLEDLPEVEVAEILGCSVGTVRSQTHKAIARLRELVPGLTADLAPIEELS